MENFSFLDTENCGVGDKPKGEKMVKGSVVRTMPRKRLNDISNLQLPKPSTQVDKSQPNPVATKEYIEQLHKENAALMKVLADRNKIIELSGIELHKLQINLQRVQQQNMQLAQANSHMLAELNTGKDRLKALHHELGCKNGLIEALKFDALAKARKITCQESGDKIGTLKCDGTAESSQAEEYGGKPDNTNRRLQSENQTLLHSGKQDKANEKTEHKRRRQSSRFKSEDPKPNEDLFEIDDAIFPVCRPLREEPVHDSGPTSSGLEVKEEDNADCAPGCEVQQSRRSSIGPQRRVKEEDKGDCAPGSGVQQSRRSSIGRPQRRAAEKIQSYKEVPLNAKMRRSA